MSTWYDQQPDSTKEQFLNLIHKGQLEIVGGGWVQHDEALTSLELAIRQIEMGHDYLFKNLGIHQVRVAWQIDPFGNSAMTPALMSKMGYEFLVINRIDQRLKNQMKEDASLEFIWEGSDIGGDNKILTHVLYDHYEYPKAFLQHSNEYCLGGSNDATIVSNCVRKIKELIEKRKKSYKTDNIMLPLGNDFEYENFNRESRIFRLIDLVMGKI